MRTSLANDFASDSFSRNQSLSAATSALSKVCRREANSARVAPSTRARTQKLTIPSTTAPSKGHTQKCLESSSGARVANLASLPVVAPVSSAVIFVRVCAGQALVKHSHTKTKHSNSLATGQNLKLTGTIG